MYESRTGNAINDFKGWIYYLLKDYPKSAARWLQFKNEEEKMNDKSSHLPYRHRLGMTYEKMGRHQEAIALIAEAEDVCEKTLTGEYSTSWENLGSVHYDLACCLSYFGKKGQAITQLDSAMRKGFTFDFGLENDPLLDPLRNEKLFNDLLFDRKKYNAFRKRAFVRAIDEMGLSRQIKDVLASK